METANLWEAVNGTALVPVIGGRAEERVLETSMRFMLTVRSDFPVPTKYFSSSLSLCNPFQSTAFLSDTRKEEIMENVTLIYY